MTAVETRPLLAITMGDPAGVGPEVVVGALSTRRVREACRSLIIGDARQLQRAAEALGRRFRVRTVSLDEVSETPAPVSLLDLRNADPEQIPMGEVTAAAGAAAAASIRAAVDLAQDGTVAGIVTAPINKEALRLANVPYPGHTEMLAALCGAERVAMMLVHGDMRVSHVTTHVALRRACDLVTQERVLGVILLTDEALRRVGLQRPRIAVAGLNPHAGESGLFGDEEIREIGPAVEQARDEGLEVFGPLPPDSVFARHRAGEFDAVVAMTHDHGHIAVKTVGFELAKSQKRPSGRRSGGKNQHSASAVATGQRLRVSGVNLTLGLPIIRTSVDHGTAFDIAGQGLADPSSMVEAVLLAARLARSAASA